MATNDPRWRPRGRCKDCKRTYPLDEAVLHECEEADARVRATKAYDREAVASFRRWLLAVLAVAITFWVVLGLMAKWLMK